MQFMHEALKHHFFFLRGITRLWVPFLSLIIAYDCILAALHHQERVAKSRGELLDIVDKVNHAAEPTRSDHSHSLSLVQYFPQIVFLLAHSIDSDGALHGKSFKNRGD